MNRTTPRVEATFGINPVSNETLCDGIYFTTPGVDITVTWDLGDHANALAHLDSAVRQVRGQIAKAGGAETPTYTATASNCPACEAIEAARKEKTP